MGQKTKAFLQLCRPANLPTSAADILAGLALAGFFDHFTIELGPLGGLLVLSSIFLYAGGVVLNDVFDIELDKVERPERPLPKGIIKIGEARIFGFGLLVIGLALAFLVTTMSGMIAAILVFFILTYDSYSKNRKVLGPLNMGICRGMNLLLGMSVFAELGHFKYAIIPIIYIAAITMISQGEVNGNNKKNIVFAGILYLIVVVIVLYFNTDFVSNLGVSHIFVLVFILSIGIPLTKAYLKNTPSNIKKAVKAGVISIILLDSVIAVAHSNFAIGLVILALLPVSIVLSKAFAVT